MQGARRMRQVENQTLARKEAFGLGCEFTVPANTCLSAATLNQPVSGHCGSRTHASWALAPTVPSAYYLSRSWNRLRAWAA